MNKKLWLSLLLALCLAPFSLTAAAGVKAGTIYVPKDEIISGNLYAAGETVTVDGSVSGDLIVAARSVHVTGRVEGDIIAAGQEIVIDGAVGGNIRAAANSLTINGSVARNVNAFGSLVVLGPSSRIGWDVFLAGAAAEVRGNIEGGLSGGSGTLLIAGRIGKDVNLNLPQKNGATELTVAPATIVGGNLNYTSEQPAVISEQASIAGEIHHSAPAAQPRPSLLSWLWNRLFMIFGAFLTGLTLIYLTRGHAVKIANSIMEKPAHTILSGLILLFILPPIAVALMITLIGFPLALIILALWLTTIYVGKILVAIALGQKVLSLIQKTSDKNIQAMIIGVIIIWLIAGIPYVGWLFCLAASILGIGGLWNYAYHKR